MSDLWRPTYAKVNLSNLKHNYLTLMQESGHPFFCPMVKANAYGHGDRRIALELQSLGVQRLGVGLIEEAEHLRQAGFSGQIIFFGITNKENVEALIQYNVTPVISNFLSLELLSKKVFNSKFKIHLKIDSGMHRFGFQSDEIFRLKKCLDSHSNLKIEGVMTHLAKGEDIESPLGLSHQQIHKFEQSLQHLTVTDPVHLHVLNSAGLVGAINKPELNLNRFGARPGLALYGYSPLLKIKGQVLKPVLSLHSKIVHSFWVKPGDSVSYGHTWTALQRSLIGVIPMGYADGLPRALSNQVSFELLGHTIPQIGNVTMDNVMVDLTSLAQTFNVDTLMDAEVLLLQAKSQVTKAYDWALSSNSIIWEVLTRIGERVPRLYVNE